MSVYLFAAPPPLGPLGPPDKDSIQSSSFSVKLTKASNEKGIVRYVGGGGGGALHRAFVFVRSSARLCHIFSSDGCKTDLILSWRGFPKRTEYSLSDADDDTLHVLYYLRVCCSVLEVFTLEMLSVKGLCRDLLGDLCRGYCIEVNVTIALGLGMCKVDRVGSVHCLWTGTDGI